MSDKQLDLWKSSFGVDYAERNRNWSTEERAASLSKIFGNILSRVKCSQPKSVLEVGCNLGRNLVALKPLVEKVYGVEPNEAVVKQALQDPRLSGVDIQVGDGFSLPFSNGSVDMTFTSGVLIHVHPDNLGKMTDEIYRVAKDWILCIEYFSDKPETISYRGKDDFLFKRDFGRFYLDRFKGLEVVDYGFIWEPVDLIDNLNWWLFRKKER